MTYNFYAPTRVLFGAGQLNHLHEQTMPGRKALVVISNGKSTRVNGYLDRTLAELKQAGVDSIVFDQVAANPLKSTVEEGAKLARTTGADFIVALGGGSVMDAAKAIAAAVFYGGDPWDMIFHGQADVHVPLKALPLVTVTWLAATGSEMNCGAVITNEET